PTVAFLNDYDDATPLLDMATAMQYQNLKMVQFNNSTPTGGIKKKFSPKPVAAMYNTALTTGYSAVAKPVWIDMTYVNVPHYGLKCHSDSVSSLTAADTLLGRFQWKIDVIFKCKGIR
ncbi:hypothetical protein MEO41_28010, partial [Dolichospermum sp. ST_sed4]|nr:hypothetical protein [Dolichospermum sp. ST_sed4]